jgi:hypothetical protein
MMDLDKLEKLAKIVLAKKPSYPSVPNFNYNQEFAMMFRNLMMVATESLPEHTLLFSSAIKNTFNFDDARSIICHLLEILKIENESKALINEMKIFDSADEKMKQAGLCFERGDYPAVLNCLNTVLELVLKDKLNIPATITNINTSNIIDILVKYKIEPYLYLIEARKYVLTFDNKIKHTGYSPSKIDCINGMKAMEELIGKLRNVNLELSEEMNNKIFEGL